MAFSLEDHVEKYPDTPLTNFPVTEDSIDRMSDVSNITLPLMQQFNTYIQNGSLSAANSFLADNPVLQECLFNATKFNTIRDAVIAIERFFLEDVEDLIDNVASSTVGINDNPTEEEKSLVAYSAEKVDNLHKIRQITIPASGWSNSYPYLNSVSVEGLKANTDLKVVSVYLDEDATEAEVKAANKAVGYLMYNDNGIEDGIITFKAYKKPTVNFTVITEGG